MKRDQFLNNTFAASCDHVLGSSGTSRLSALMLLYLSIGAQLICTAHSTLHKVCMPQRQTTMMTSFLDVITLILVAYLQGTYGVDDGRLLINANGVNVFILNLCIQNYF